MAGPNTCLQDRLVVIDSHPYAVIHRRWPSFSGCCGSCLEQSIAARHIRAVTASLPQSPQDTSLQALCFPWLCCCAWEVTSSFSDTLIVFVVVSYLPSCTHYDDTTWKYCIHLAQNALFFTPHSVLGRGSNAFPRSYPKSPGSVTQSYMWTPTVDVCVAVLARNRVVSGGY